MCTSVHHGILKGYRRLPQLSSLWPCHKLTVFRIILLSFKWNAVPTEAVGLQFSEGLVSFSSKDVTVLKWSLHFLFSLSCCKKQRRKCSGRSVYTRFWGVEQTGKMNSPVRCQPTLPLECQMPPVGFFLISLKMAITKSNPPYSEPPKPWLNVNDMWD